MNYVINLSVHASVNQIHTRESNNHQDISRVNPETNINIDKVTIDGVNPSVDKSTNPKNDNANKKQWSYTTVFNK